VRVCLFRHSREPDIVRLKRPEGSTGKMSALVSSLSGLAGLQDFGVEASGGGNG